MFQGIGLVLIVLILFLGSPRSALIVGITIPFAMVVAFILMNHTNISANLLSLGAIDFGIIVDGAIVMTEAILRRREAKPTEPLTEDDARAAARQVARPIFFATAIIITAYLPLFAFQRIEAKLFYPMAYAVGYAQFGALAVRARGGAGARLSGLSQAAPRLPQPRARMARGALSRDACTARCAARRSPMRSPPARRLRSPASAPPCGANSCPSSTRARSGCMPSCRPASRCRRRARWWPTCARAVNEFPEVSYVVTHTGRNDDGTDPWTPSHIEAAVGLHAVRHLAGRRDQAGSDPPHDASGSTGCPGFEIAFSQPIIDSVLDKVFDPHSALAIKVFGDDFDELRRIGQRHRRACSTTMPGVTGAAIDQYRRCRSSPSRSIARRRRATASTSPTWST